MDERRYRKAGARKWVLLVLAAGGIVALVYWRWRRSCNEQFPPPNRVDNSLSLFPPDQETQSRIAAFCGDCHALPLPESFPRDRWHDAVRTGYEYYARSGRTDLVPPTMQAAIAYYRSLAPARLIFPSAQKAPEPPQTTFISEGIDWNRNRDIQPAVSYLRWCRLDAGRDPVLLTCDMREGSVAAVDLRRKGSPRRILAQLNHPCHLEPCDLDGDGRQDLVVTDLGSFYAIDHDQGRVIWLRRREGAETFEEQVLASGLGRVADVRSGDFDGDGDVDLLVAEFGHYRTGGILLLRNTTVRGESLHFELERIDSRPGTIHLPLHDFDGDGRLDFVALVSQEYECVDLFLNRGIAPFQRRTLWAGPDLTFGSSGLELVDLNLDGKEDLLFTNGDSFDNLYANPSHGVQWLENLGGQEFAYHRLADLPGAYRALGGDFDNDGDTDVVVAAWLPRQVMPPELRESPLTSLILLEQTSPGSFVRHTLETGSPHYAAMEVADFDGDGDLDFVAGMHVGLDDAGALTRAPLAVWWNQATSAAK